MYEAKTFPVFILFKTVKPCLLNENTGIQQDKSVRQGRTAHGRGRRISSSISALSAIV